MTMTHNPTFLETPELDLECWIELLRSLKGRYSPRGVDVGDFAGRALTRQVCGFEAIDLSCNAERVERTRSDVRLDQVDHYYAIFQLAGRSAMKQKDEMVVLDAGDVTLGSSTRPVTYFPAARDVRWLSLTLPREQLISHLGYEPKEGRLGRGASCIGRVLFQLVVNAAQEADGMPASAHAYVKLAVYDLLGALFASESTPVTLHSDRMFLRISEIIRSRFADPDLSPQDVAADAGISLRYLQKLFTQRGSTCSHSIQSVRLDHAATLMRRKAVLGTRQPISEIAYACGFRDYIFFAKKFRKRFGCSPKYSSIGYSDDVMSATGHKPR